MRPYFEYVKGINFSEETRKKLADNILSNAEDYIRSANYRHNKYGKYDWNWFCPRNLIPTDLMDEVGKRFKIPVHYEILGQTPFTIGKIHVDQKNPFVPRVSVISIPVYPLDIRSFGPTKFWTLESGEYSDYDNAKFKLQETINYTDHTAVIFNLLEYHNATNETNDYRFHCQFSTDIPFNEIVELYDKGKLFKLN